MEAENEPIRYIRQMCRLFALEPKCVEFGIWVLRLTNYYSKPQFAPKFYGIEHCYVAVAIISTKYIDDLMAVLLPFSVGQMQRRRPQLA